MASVDYYQDQSNDPAIDSTRIEQLEMQTLKAYEQWEALTAEE